MRCNSIFVSSLLVLCIKYLASRELYEKFPVSGGEFSVSTLSNEINHPSGIENGYYKGKYGCFVSSFTLQAIYFINLRSYSHILVAGTLYSGGSSDGQLLHSTFLGPSRMAYDHSNSRLFIAERGSGLLRVLDFNADQTKTVFTTNAESVKFEKRVQASSSFPGLDVQLSGQTLYVVDTIKLYAVTSASGDLKNIVSNAVVREYTSLSEYFNVNGYPLSANARSCVYSVAPDDKRKVLYVAISFAKNVLLKVPMDPTQSYLDITVLAGDASSTYPGGVVAGYPPPIAANGNVQDVPSTVRLAFPLHLRLSSDSSTLFFSEAYPTTSDAMYLFGSLMVRRLVLATGEVDSYCGVDFSNLEFNTTWYEAVGSAGGYKDGEVSLAEFRYPMSIDVIAMDNKQQGGFLPLVVVDHSNNAVRLVAAFMDTPAPSASPTAVPLIEEPAGDPGAPSAQLGGNAVIILSVSLGMCCCVILFIILWMGLFRRRDHDKLDSVDRADNDVDKQWATVTVVPSPKNGSERSARHGEGPRTDSGELLGVFEDRDRSSAMGGILGSVTSGIKRIMKDRHNTGVHEWGQDWSDDRLLELSISSHSDSSVGDDVPASSRVAQAADLVSYHEGSRPSLWDRMYNTLAGTATDPARSAQLAPRWQSSDRWDEVDESVIIL